jgi:hypothetical protein
MAENNTNRTVMLLAGAVVVLLIAFVAVVLLNSGSGSGPAATTPDVALAPTSTTQPGMGSSSATAFDPATATKVPAGETPKAFVSAYYQAILDKKWDAAFKMQPYTSQVGQTVAAFQETQEKMYGMTEFTIFSDTTGSTDATVVARQVLGTNGVWNTAWTFVNSGGTWLVKTRKVGMGEPVKP